MSETAPRVDRLREARRRQFERCPCCNRALQIGPQFHTRRGPAAALRRLKGRPLTWCCSPTWFDHCYTVRRDDSVVYICEPYELRTDAFADLALLAGAGWTIFVSAGAALHVPGQTTRIEMTPPHRGVDRISKAST